jgi:hypothetical protein
LVWIAASWLLLAACGKKSLSATTGTAGQHVYIAGDNGTNPVLWTDSTAQILSPSVGTATQVVKAGDDVYVAGVSGEAGYLLPSGPSGIYAYWKNGQQVNVADTMFLRATPSVAIAGGRLYFTNGSLWTNGDLTPLSDQGVTGQVMEVYASGNDLYAVGSDNSDAMVYWKNGQLNSLSMGNANTGLPVAFCIYVSGNDIYVGGRDAEDKPAYWKNGVLNELKPADPSSSASTPQAIVVSGNDVYVVANYYYTYMQPAYWKNGVQQNLPLNGAKSGIAYDICKADTSVYVVGQTDSGAVCWKNGVEKVLAARGTANSIIVQ